MLVLYQVLVEILATVLEKATHVYTCSPIESLDTPTQWTIYHYIIMGGKVSTKLWKKYMETYAFI